MKILVINVLIMIFLNGWSGANELPADLANLVAKRKNAISEIDRRYFDELRLLREKYKKQGDLDSVNAVEKLIDGQEQVAELPASSMLGEWVFFYKGLKRIFRFAEDGSFTGHYPLSGNEFEGKWKDIGGRIVLEVNGVKGRWATVKVRQTGEADLVSGDYKMTGKQNK